MKKRTYDRWAILWPGNDLTRDTLVGSAHTRMTQLFLTREQARQDPRTREFNAMLRRRKDLRSPPFNWRARRPVKVRVTVELADD